MKMNQTLHTWKNAYSWLKSSLSKTLVRAEQEGDYQLYYTKSATAGDLTLNKSFILKYKSQLLSLVYCRSFFCVVVLTFFI